MRVFWTFFGILPVASMACWSQQPEPGRQLVREVVYNELQDHQTHGYWRYWVEHRAQNGTRIEEQVETADGPVTRVVAANGRPVDEHTREVEQSRLEQMANSPAARASHRREYADDEKRVGEVFAELPNAFLFLPAGDENGCHHFTFRPNPAYAAHSIQSRIFQAMSGDIWLDARMKRLVRIEGHLDSNVDFGFGLLGHLDKGGWFRMERGQVSPTEWKTTHLEVHMTGRAMLFTTIAHETSEIRGGFAAVPAGMNLAQGMNLLEQSDPRSSPATMAHAAPVSLSKR